MPSELASLTSTPAIPLRDSTADSRRNIANTSAPLQSHTAAFRCHSLKIFAHGGMRLKRRLAIGADLLLRCCEGQP